MKKRQIIVVDNLWHSQILRAKRRAEFEARVIAAIVISGICFITMFAAYWWVRLVEWAGANAVLGHW